MRTSAEDLARLFGGRLVGAAGGAAVISSITTDSRDAVPGGAFVALRGGADDGHRHVGDAARRGALLAVVDAAWPAPEPCPPLLVRVDDTGAALRAACAAALARLGCTTVAITGSAGKTTARGLCTLALGGLAVAGTAGNLNTWTGIPLSVLPLAPPLDVFVAEMAMSAPGEIADLCAFVHPEVGVLLNVGLAHVGLLGSIDAIAAAKAELLEALPHDGLAVCNADDPWVRRVAPRSGAPVSWFGLRHGDAAFRAEALEASGLEGTRVRLHGPDGSADTVLRVPGEHVLLDACAAAAVAARFGVGIAEVAGRVAAFTAPPHRGAVVAGARGALVYDDCYNSSPSSLAAALDTLAACGRPRRVAVLGDMLELGDHATAAHDEAGRHAGRAATDLVAVGEHARRMVAAAVGAGMDPRAAVAASGAAAAARLALEACSADTAVLVKASRGLRLETVVEAITA